MKIEVQDTTYPVYYIVTPEHQNDVDTLTRLIPAGMGANKQFRIVRDAGRRGGGYFEFVPAGINLVGKRTRCDVSTLPELWVWLTKYIDNLPAPIPTL